MTSDVLVYFHACLTAIVLLPFVLFFIFSLGLLPDIVSEELKKFKGLRGFISHYFLVKKESKWYEKVLDVILSTICISYMLFIYGIQRTAMVIVLILLIPLFIVGGIVALTDEKLHEKFPRKNSYDFI